LIALTCSFDKPALAESSTVARDRNSSERTTAQRPAAKRWPGPIVKLYRLCGLRGLNRIFGRRLRCGDRRLQLAVAARGPLGMGSGIKKGGRTRPSTRPYQLMARQLVRKECAVADYDSSLAS
jgi:hypothetical protein